jgi:hypothetical protein
MGLWLPGVFSGDRAGFAHNSRFGSFDERGYVSKDNQLAQTRLSLENFAASALESQGGGGDPWLPESRPIDRRW